MARSNTTNTPPAAEAPATEAQAESITLTGRLCADPVLRHTKSGRAVTNIRIAVNNPDAEATFHSVVVWRRTAEVVARYMRKGRMVEVTGNPRSRTWTDSDGNERESVEINAYRVHFVRSDSSAPAAEREAA